jgi:hypothetical protein
MTLFASLVFFRQPFPQRDVRTAASIQLSSGGEKCTLESSRFGRPLSLR